MVAWPTTGGSEGTWNDEMKTYVDVEHELDGTHKGTVAGLSAYTALDSENNTLLKAHAYLATSAGFVTAWATDGAELDSLNGYVGLTDDPVGAGNAVQSVNVPTVNYTVNVSFPVASGEYFEITIQTGAATIFWKSIGTTLNKPVDQD